MTMRAVVPRCAVAIFQIMQFVISHRSMPKNDLLFIRVIIGFRKAPAHVQKQMRQSSIFRDMNLRTCCFDVSVVKRSVYKLA